jgi:hypothetical protein
MIRHYLLPVVLTAGAIALGLCLSIIGLGAVHGDLLSGIALFALAAFPFWAIGLLALMPIVELVRRRPWPIGGKAWVIFCAGGLLGTALLAWVNFILGALCGALSALVWLCLNWRHLQSSSITSTI